MRACNQPDQPVGQVNTYRCLDHELIVSILRRDYFDDPMPYLSEGVIQTLAREWIANRSQVYLLAAEADGEYAGFVFGHTLGPKFWRLFASSHPWVFPALALARLKMRLAPKIKLRPVQSQPNKERNDLEAQIAALEISTLSQPFAWAPEGSRTGILPLVFVHPEHRGKGVAPHLLKQIVEAMLRDGAKSVEAHINIDNLASVRAFLKAGFEVYRMATNDFWARKVERD